jgi:hypothetical protein
MRWPWEWGRRADVTDAGAAEAGDSSRGPASGSVGSAGGSASATALPSTPSSSRAWISLPPVQRSLADTAPSVAPPDAFRSSLTTQQNPGFLAPLGHLVDRDGPSGVVGGLASSVAEPIPYEGAAELRVPDPHAGKQAPAVQRRIAELHPDPAPAVADDDSISPVDNPPTGLPQVEPRQVQSRQVDSRQVEPAQVEAPPVESPAVQTALLAEQPVLSTPTGSAPSGADGSRVDAVAPRPADQAAREPLVVARQVEAPAGSSTPPSSGAGSSGSSVGTSTSHPVPVQRLADDRTGHDHLSTDRPAVDGHPVDRPAVERAPDDRPVRGESEADRSGASIHPVVQRATTAEVPAGTATSAVEQPTTDRPEVAAPILGRRLEAGAAVEPPVAVGASPATRTPESLPALVVPVQRTASTIPGRSQPPTEPGPAHSATFEGSGSTGGGESAGPVQRFAEPGSSEHPSTGTDSARQASAEPATAVDSAASLETAVILDGSVVPSAIETASEATAPAGLLGDRAPLLGTTDSAAAADQPAGTAAADPLIVVGHRDSDPEDSVQRFASTLSPTLSPATLEAQPPATEANPAEPTRTSPSGPSAGEAGDLSASAGSSTGYPPLVARPVQRRTADAASGRAHDEQAPLSGFAAAISALNGGAPIQPSTSADHSATDSGEAAGPSDLVVARQAATMPAPAAGAGGSGRPASAARSSASFAAPRTRVVPELVVARRLAPDGGGNLPVADVRVTAPGSLSGGPSPSTGGSPSIVERSLIADQPPLVPNDPSPGWTEMAPSAPAVQRIQYEDLTVAPTDRFVGDAGDGRGGASVGHVPRGALPTAQRAVAAGSTSGSVPSTGSNESRLSSTTAAAVRLDPVGALGSASRTEAALPSWSSSAPAPAQTVVPSAQQALDSMPEGFGGTSGLLLTPVQRTTPASPAPAAELTPMVQRRFDTPSPAATATPAAASASAASGVSGRTVGLAEMFALASAQADAETVQRSADESVPSPAETQVQLEAAPASSPSATPSAPAAGAPGAAAPSGADLDEMARRLYEPLTARLRAELWQDRERSGLLTDLRP